MKRLKVFIMCSLALLTACTSFGQLDANAPAPSDSESVFVLGVSPDNYRVSIFPGSVSDGSFSSSLIRTAVVYGAAKQGFVVGKASAGDVLAITNVRVVSDSSSILGANFKPCGGAKTMVFEVPKGKVVYLGSVEYKFEGKQLLVQYRNDIEGARRHIDQNFPALKGKLETVDFKLLPKSGSCDSTIYVPIYR